MTLQKTFTLNRYKKNLRIEGDRVMSYNTHVATIKTTPGYLLELGKWSQTTSKHVNYVARELGLKKLELWANDELWDQLTQNEDAMQGFQELAKTI